MKKALFTFLAAALLIGALVVPANAESHGVTCSLSGDATIKPGLTTTGGAYTVKFTGELTDCQSTGDATSGAVKATAKANGSCGEATAEGIAVVKWDDGKTTKVSFTTTDIGALVILQATVVSSTESALAKGDSEYGVLAFQADPTLCAGDGVTEASFTGQIGGGNPQ